MGFTKDDFEKIDKRLVQITQQSVEQWEISSDFPPTLDDLPDSNKAYAINAAILIIDIRKSTYLTENSQAKSMVKVYRAFVRMAVSCVRVNGGVTRQFLGDRIMGVFIDSLNENGEIIDSAVDKAMNCARSMQTTLDFSLNKLLKNNVNGKIISCGIGIDYGKVLLTKVGMYGVEKDEAKENEIDCVWVGKYTNNASKYSDLAGGGQIFISDNTYRLISESHKPEGIWESIAKYKAGVAFKGYIASNFYLDFAEELGEPTNIDEIQDNEDTNSIAEAIIEIDKIRERLAKKEIELKLLEQKLKQEQAKNDETNKASLAQIDSLKKSLKKDQQELYRLLSNHLYESYLKEEYLINMGFVFWEKTINRLLNIGKILGKTERDIIAEHDCYLVRIYTSFKVYDKAYQTMIIMAEENGHWVYIERETILWAKSQGIINQLQNAIENRMKNLRNNTNIENYQKYFAEIKQIVG